MRSCVTLVFFFIWLCCFGNLTVMCYKIPQAKLEILQNGFRVSIPHETGIENVAFNINRNRPFKGFEPGEFSGRIRTQAANQWFFESQRHLQDDDIIYVWTDVQYNKSRYRSMSSPITVRQTTPGGPSQHSNEVQPAFTTERSRVTSEEPLITSKKPPIIGEECESSLTTIRNRNICKGQLIFEENFDGTELDSSRWRYEVRLPLDVADAEFVLYDTNAELINGVLKIEPRLWGNDSPDTNIRRGHLNLGTRCTANQNPQVECQRQPFGQVVLPPVLSARINTKHAFTFKYGRVEVRAKLPQGDWLFPLLLLEPLVNFYGQHPYASGQMRIAFIRSNLNLRTREGVEEGGRVLHGGAVLSSEANTRDTFMANTSQDQHFGETFHIYSLTWNDRQLSLDVDGKNYGTVDGGFAQKANGYNNAWANSNYMAPFDQEFFLTLGVAAGGHGDFSDDYVSKPWANTSPKAALNFWRNRQSWKSTWTSPALQVDYMNLA
ncbi:PREDICTED: gram-negative bacteria-binding protein 1 isoform X2 [Rhagoletis zephyria]|uniref:gram-negative bacteria-binding protein 1 isoform X2 n=1 Tax=Rhagoletis zephyria TaxID=28612 RepID=UPI0008115E25|nr:PREDICTED: gram-negative bacteria-binding protein 1 isoform X2 [Rhagoletis zephyria]